MTEDRDETAATEELSACLDVLIEHADRLVERRAESVEAYQRKWAGATVKVPTALLTEGDELITALYQTVGLVLELLDENDQAWDAIEVLRRVVLNAQDQLQGKPDVTIWTPSGVAKP